MNNVMDFSSKEDIDEQASLWISRIDRGLTDEERIALQQWVNQGTHQQAALTKYAKLWDNLSVLNELASLLPLEQSAREQERGTVWPPSTRHAIAASFVGMMAFASIWFAVQIAQHSPIVALEQTNPYVTEKGKQRLVELEDGSVVHLNTDSEIQLNYTAEQRSITLLKGEAHFDVFHDATRPFVVTVGDRDVTAVGTAFAIEKDPQQKIQVLVTEGKVSVDSEIYLDAGANAIFDGSQAPSVNVLPPEQIQKVLAWQQGMLVFQGERIEDVITEIMRYSEVTFEIMDEATKAKRVAGYFKIGDVNGLLSSLKYNLQVEAQEKTPSHFVLYSETN
jgi:transmembrane sensor